MKPIPFKNITIAFFIAITALFILFKTNPDTFPQKTLGSFEYIRKADELLEKGNLVEAIVYFEKAHNSSPDNDTIAQNLAYAYSRYAERLEESEYYDKAIAYLTNAREVYPSPSTIQNLAIAHSKKAIAEAAGGDRMSAMEAFELARSIAADSDNASRSLSISLFNDAVDAYLDGKKSLAILLLKESALAHSDPAVFEMLGDINYKEKELVKARFYWVKAKELGGDEKTLLEKMEKVDKEIRLEAKEKVERLPHFDLRYDKDLPVNEDLAKELLEKAYFEVGDKLSYFPSDRTTVYFYSKPDFKSIFKMTGMVRAFYDGSIRMPFPDESTDRDEFAHYIYHEYAHAVVSAKTHNRCPVWLSEGIAMWIEFNGSALRVPLSQENIDKAMVSLDDLEKIFTYRGDPAGNISFYYMLAYTVVDYIVDNWSLDGLNLLLTRISKGQHAINAIDDEFLLSQKEFEKRWHDNIIAKYLK